ncbi:MAG: dephospho-CoA kinase [Actinomycetia bacterium]|nr:dephospho-CoA kinase [Actinomycetes bacterium]
MIVVVTGPICAGKSTALAQLQAEYEDQGMSVLNLGLDRIGHEVLEELYGPDLDRAALAKQVFSNYDELDRLSAKIHPLILGKAENLAGEFLGNHPEGIVLIESAVPLSADDYPWLEEADVRIVDEVYSIRRARAIGRGMSAKQFEARDKAQRRYVYE